MSRSTPSSPVFGVLDQDTLCIFRDRRAGEGVRGGEEVTLVLALMLKLWIGRSASSSSLWSGDRRSSATVEVSDAKDMFEKCDESMRLCLFCLIGEDSGRLCVFFHGSAGFLPLLPLPDIEVPSGGLVIFADRILFRSLPPECVTSSENIGAVKGELLRPLLECIMLDVVEAASEIVSLLEAGRFLT